MSHMLCFGVVFLCVFFYILVILLSVSRVLCRSNTVELGY